MSAEVEDNELHTSREMALIAAKAADERKANRHHGA